MQHDRPTRSPAQRRARSILATSLVAIAAGTACDPCEPNEAVYDPTVSVVASDCEVVHYDRIVLDSSPGNLPTVIAAYCDDEWVTFALPDLRVAAARVELPIDSTLPADCDDCALVSVLGRGYSAYIVAGTITITVDEAVGTAAPYPALTTDDFHRQVTVSVRWPAHRTGVVDVAAFDQEFTFVQNADDYQRPAPPTDDTCN